MDEYRLIRSGRKSLSVEIMSDGQVVVRAPRRFAKKEIECFLASRREWISFHRQKALARPQAQPHRFAPGERFYFLGNALSLAYRAGLRRIEVEGSLLLIPEERKEEAGSLLTAWYRSQAKEILTERVHSLEGKTGLRSTGLRITSAQKRWGSCSGRNSLNFSWYLVMAPIEVIDSVVIHELCHTVHHDHSRDFWALVHQLLPNYDDRHRWLSENRALLRLEAEQGFGYP